MSMNNKIYIVTAADVAETANGIPEKIGQFDTYEEASELVIQEMREYCDRYTFVDEDTGKTYGPRTYDEGKMFVENYDGTESCQWAIVEANA